MSRLILVFLFAAFAWTADFRAGVARLDITPEGPVWMSGYASRNKPSEGIYERLWAKALAIENGRRNRVVIVTTDLIGLPRSVSEEVAARVLKEYKLDRSQLLLNSSHTHTGPVVRDNLITMWELPEAELEKIRAYSRLLVDRLVTVIGAAMAAMQPARLEFGEGKAGFAINRREVTPQGIKLGLNPSGPVDHSVPVVAVRGDDGSLRAVLFGYACHNTTLGGNVYEIGGDYAGKAQAVLEEKHPGATAMFLMLCGGDANPNPRGEMKHVEEHGTALAETVSHVLHGKLIPVRGRLRSAFLTTQLPFRLHTREDFEKEMNDSNVARRKRAQLMLQAYDERRPVRSVLFPVQAIRFGDDLTILALGGEVVVDYALRAKREFDREHLIVAGYSNDVMCYIPSKRVLLEGGYEADTSMIYYGQPGPFAEEVEDVVFTAIRQVMRRAGAKVR
jgi:neutral ceramidase